MTRAFVTIRYSCHLCGIEKREVRVRARENEDVVQWLEQVCMVDLGADHAAVSPYCHPTELKDIMIPLSGVDKVGGVVKQ
jgi:hypothetical protein